MKILVYMLISLGFFAQAQEQQPEVEKAHCTQKEAQSILESCKSDEGLTEAVGVLSSIGGDAAKFTADSAAEGYQSAGAVSATAASALTLKAGYCVAVAWSCMSNCKEEAAILKDYEEFRANNIQVDDSHHPPPTAKQKFLLQNPDKQAKIEAVFKEHNITGLDSKDSEDGSKITEALKKIGVDSTTASDDQNKKNKDGAFNTCETAYDFGKQIGGEAYKHGKNALANYKAANQLSDKPPDEDKKPLAERKNVLLPVSPDIPYTFNYDGTANNGIETPTAQLQAEAQAAAKNPVASPSTQNLPGESSVFAGNNSSSRSPASTSGDTTILPEDEDLSFLDDEAYNTLPFNRGKHSFYGNSQFNGINSRGRNRRAGSGKSPYSKRNRSPLLAKTGNNKGSNKLSKRATSGNKGYNYSSLNFKGSIFEQMTGVIGQFCKEDHNHHCR